MPRTPAAMHQLAEVERPATRSNGRGVLLGVVILVALAALLFATR